MFLSHMLYGILSRSRISFTEHRFAIFAFCLLFLQLPALQDDGPASDNYGRFSNSDRRSDARRPQRGSMGRGGFRSSWGDNDDEGGYKRGGGRGGGRSENRWSKDSRSGGNDWLIGDRRSSRPSFGGSRSPSFGGSRSPSFAGKDRYVSTDMHLTPLGRIRVVKIVPFIAIPKTVRVVGNLHIATYFQH